MWIGRSFSQKKKKKLNPWGKNTVNTGKLGMSTMKQGEPYKSIQNKFHHVTNETHLSPGVQIGFLRFFIQHQLIVTKCMTFE